ncbi:Putative 54S ribosomal protein L25 [Septoria linicola]|uniref:54S ribosomal protein L25 n=1 Tax=Septoria linicola TaxID=215465 RepID=A0A9Q9B5M4_9PEZI|nr:Putative 54S ribosomal protein L25 [Septoria linicola]
MAAAIESHIRLAQQLPPRLLHFFKKYPPSTMSTTSSSDPNVVAAVTESLSQTSMTDSSAGLTDKKTHNPFLPFKNPRTGAYHGPAYSLRRQADLYKLAKSCGVLALMPIAPKHPEIKEQNRIERGLRVQGTGEGKRVKGKMWERTMRSKLEERRKAMEGMNAMVVQWKERGHGRGWKKWPK